MGGIRVMMCQYKPTSIDVQQVIKGILIGNSGKPDRYGNAVGGYVRETEKKYNALMGEYWHEQVNEASTLNMHVTIDENQRKILMTPMSGDGLAILGWYGCLKEEENIMLQITCKDVVRTNLHSRMMDDSKKLYYIDWKETYLLFDDEMLELKMVGKNMLNSRSTLIPLLFRIGQRGKLHLVRDTLDFSEVELFMTMFNGECTEKISGRTDYLEL